MARTPIPLQPFAGRTIPGAVGGRLPSALCCPGRGSGDDCGCPGPSETPEESGRLPTPYQPAFNLIVLPPPDPDRIVPITEPQPGCRPPSTGFGGECNTARLPQPTVDESTNFVWQGNHWVPIREADTLPWVAMEMDAHHLNMTGRQAGDQATSPLMGGAIVQADFNRAIPVWSSSSAWRAIQGQQGKLEAIRGCKRRYSFEYGARGEAADGAAVSSPAASMDFLAFRLGDIVRRLYGFYQQFNSPTARAMLNDVQLAIEDNSLAPDRRRYDFDLRNSVHLEISMSLSFGRVTVPNRPDIGHGTNIAPLNVDGVFSGIAPLAVEFTQPDNPMNSPIRVRPSAASVAMVGGGNPLPFGNRVPNIPLPPLMSDGNISFVSSGMFVGNPTPFSPVSALIGYRPSDRPPAGGLIRAFRALDLQQGERHVHPVGLDRERAFSDRLIDSNKRAAWSNCKRLRFSTRIGRPLALVSHGPQECDPLTIKLANEMSVAFSPEDVARAQRAGVDIRGHLFSRNPGINTHIGTRSDTVTPVCGSPSLQAVLVGIFSDIENCPSVTQLGQGPRWPALNLKLDCVHARLVRG